jgi:hypothetical protein
MTKIASSVFLAAVLGLCLHVASAQAQYVRTCVSANGNDANTCHCSQPCRTFQRAHDQTLAQGEVTVLDPGSYGPVTITKAINIVNDGVGEASVLVYGGTTGITVNAGASDAVSLRGLTVKGIGFGGGNGILFNGGKFLTVENCTVRDLTSDGTGGGSGILASLTSSNLVVSNTFIAHNSGMGIVVGPSGSAASVTVVLSRVEMHGNFVGVFIAGDPNSSVKATVADSVAAGNGYGIAGAGKANITVVRSEISNNATGLSPNTNATIRIGQSVLTGNHESWVSWGGGPGPSGFPGTVQSYGDNYIDGNDDGNPAPPTIARK